MKNQITFLVITFAVTISCTKKNRVTEITSKHPVALLVSTEAVLLDTAWSAPKRYMHFMITFNVVSGDSDMYFSQLPVDYRLFVQFLGPDTIHTFTPYRPLTIPSIPEIIPEGDVYKITAGDTVRIEYFGMMIAHGRWTQFYMQAYGFPYSNGSNDGTYESILPFDSPFTTDMPH